MIAPATLDMVFGPKTLGATPEERAKNSNVLFVRSQDHLGIFREGATGLKLTAWEALKAFGLERLLEVTENGAVALTLNGSEPARTLKTRREALNLTPADLAKTGRITIGKITKAENPKFRSYIKDLVILSQLLGLDNTAISISPGSGGDEELAVRLRQLGDQQTYFTPREVITFDESAWIIMTQSRLSTWIYGKTYQKNLKKFEPNDNYGTPDHPAWKIGYDLANDTRRLLDIGAEAPIEKLIELCENELQIPVIQAELPMNIGGATISTSGYRGIVVNTRGASENVWIRRITIAHELGHLLYDPEKKLNKLRVDNYSEIEKDCEITTDDWVEQRANAFAVEFLAPSSAIRRIYQSTTDKNKAIMEIMETYGISYTTAKYHIYNSLWRKYDVDKLTIADSEPGTDWKGREGYTDLWFPIPSIPISKRRKFAGLVVRAEKDKYISEDSATLFLGCNSEEYFSNRESIEELFPIEL